MWKHSAVRRAYSLNDLERCALGRVLTACIRFYQRRISRWTPAVCRFTPTCSQYAVDAIEKYGALKGAWLALRRICRCHPLNKGGYDPVV